MGGPALAPLQADEMPLPMGVQAHSGQLFPGLTATDLSRIGQSPSAVKTRGEEGNENFLAVSEVDPNNLAEAGWGIVLPSGLDPAVRAALDPLIEHRRAQVGDAKLFRIFEGPAGYQDGDTVRSWLDKFSVGLNTVDPALGVPLYLLLVGSPAQIPFEFQYLLDTYWCVGRLYFDHPDEYRSYCQGVIDYETAAKVPHARSVAVFNTRNLGDRATGLLHNQVALPFAAGGGTQQPLGARQKFQMMPFLADDATKDNFTKLLQGKTPGGAPALLFSGSHGVGFEPGDPELAARQGAILCQDWEGGPIQPEQYFAASDVPADASIKGLIHFFFACYGGGCPQFDTYSRLPDGQPKPIAPATLVARLPQVLLARGAQAVLAHVDRAWAYSFQAGRSAPQIQDMRDVMVRVMKGERIGQCTDQFNLRWAVLSAELDELQRQNALFPGQVSDASLANRWVARDDARNYLILGDPACRIRADAT